MRDVMTKDYLSISKDTSIEDAMQMMTDKRVRHLPIFDGERLVGMISIGDVTRWLLQVNEMEAENLRRYVFDGYPGLFFNENKKTLQSAPVFFPKATIVRRSIVFSKVGLKSGLMNAEKKVVLGVLKVG